VRWRLHGRRLKRKVLGYRGAFAKPSKESWVVKRSDGLIYAGPFRYEGQTFTRVEALQYGYGSQSAAQRAWEELGGSRYHKGKIEVVRVR
jgi:hypothetical protein